MERQNNNIFERYPKTTLCMLVLLILFGIYGLASVKSLCNAYTEFEAKSVKTLVHQYYVGNIIDHNIGRFIKLREHRPHQERFERPTRNYVKNLEPNVLKRRYYRLKTDAQGFIEPSNIHDDPELKIVFLGGSTTECLYMDEKERFPYLVGRHLEHTLHKKVNSYNGGVSANESMHSLNILLNKVVPMKPDKVVLMHNINDLAILRSQGDYGYPHSLKSHIQTSKEVFTRYQFPVRSHLNNEQGMIREFERNLKTFIAICTIRDIQPILMTQANRVKNDALYHRFNQVIREVGAQHQVRVIDLAHQIPATKEYLYDPYHYTAQGAALAAKVMSEQLMEH